MKKAFKTINWRILNLAFWMEILLSYFLPFRAAGSARYQVGFPVPFLVVNAAGIQTSPFMSMHLNPFGLLFDGAALYLIMVLCVKAYQKVTRNRTE
ncbi:MAG: hypothetical protein HFE45_04835 [Oscillospiraceae bacterium]|jgi:hypothetical protein|nr:hypothetical protein [Oscillospiraceae bacterium]